MGANESSESKPKTHGRDRNRRSVTAQPATAAASSSAQPAEGGRRRGASGARPDAPQSITLAALLDMPSDQVGKTAPEIIEQLQEAIMTAHVLLQSVGTGDEVSRRVIGHRLKMLIVVRERLLQREQPLSGAEEVLNRKTETKRTDHPAIRRCPVMPFTQQLLESASRGEGEDEVSEDHKTCTVCWVDYAVGDSIMMLPCFHWLHEDCAKDWLTRCPQCPTCQTNVGEALTASFSFATE